MDTQHVIKLLPSPYHDTIGLQEKTTYTRTPRISGYSPPTPASSHLNTSSLTNLPCNLIIQPKPMTLKPYKKPQPHTRPPTHLIPKHIKPITTFVHTKYIGRYASPPHTYNYTQLATRTLDHMPGKLAVDFTTLST